jgi:hypothetical protein
MPCGAEVPPSDDCWIDTDDGWEGFGAGAGAGLGAGAGAGALAAGADA